MYLIQIPQKNERVRLAIYESYLNGKRTRQRTVKPIVYRFFPDNATDCATMIPTFSDMKRDHSLGRV